MATVLESSEPVSMIRRQRGMISVESKKWITVLLSFCWMTSDKEKETEVRTNLDKSTNDTKRSET